MITSIVRYQVGSYAGTIEVTHDPSFDQVDIINKAKSILRKKSGGYPLGIYCESYEVLHSENTE
jgi:hypothetical protein